MLDYNSVLNIILEDDHTPEGGIAHVDETLGEFIMTAGLPLTIVNDIEYLNKALIDNGIKPLEEESIELKELGEQKEEEK